MIKKSTYKIEPKRKDAKQTDHEVFVENFPEEVECNTAY